jgi:asparagine synthase (glutamine-hydrolysing)
MCGIAGIASGDGRPPSHHLIAKMTRALAHRGPDGVGNYYSGDVAMTQTRLAIIDLVTGDQPIREPGGAALVANGEIYNYIELRSAMPGVVFSTASDCELPLRLYRRHGLDFTAHLRGMYAIALHDPQAHRLVLARDPFGIKPLYYLEHREGFAFSSEPGALIAAGLIEPRLVPEARNQLLQLQFTAGRQTIFAGIKRVLPGEILVVEHGQIVEQRRTDAVLSAPLRFENEAEALVAIDEVFAESVMLHQRSDVPYGMFLSGGIDSSAVLAMMARLNERPVVAFTASFDADLGMNELEQARALARSFRAEHVEVEFGILDFWRLLPKVAMALDDPVADYAAVPTYKLAASARAAGIKVVLSGEGGDEMFAGYGRYRRAMRPKWLGGRAPRSHGALDSLGLLRSDFADWRQELDIAERQAGIRSHTSLQAAQAADCAEWLPNDLLLKLDRCLMAHGVEGRTPFLDRGVSTFAFGLADRFKVANGLGKVLLRKWLAVRAPAAKPFAPKQGFTVPAGPWIAHEWVRLSALVAKQGCIEEICRPDAIREVFRRAGERRFASAAWNVLFYALWYRLHIERQPVGTDVFETLA